ncbi:hypothetical protein F5050DRAFT_158276 [Lentinula boryana]|uniref:DUF6699 domain-containing protein n=1 Tax=Lentinula boryana TaxID=40481 RepID=A0ABQ8QCG1_9AGAR|nr:hypothetical protein F5050DRAFT_158276 [Lentinula boryana]
MSSSETRVTFGRAPGGPSRRFGPLHRSSGPARSIMRRPKIYTRHSASAQANTSLTRAPQDISNTLRHSVRPSAAMRAISPVPHHRVHYVGSRRHGRSNVFAFSPTATHPIRPSSRHNRHSSTNSSPNKSGRYSSHRHSRSLSGLSSTPQSHNHSHRRGHSDTHSFGSGSAGHGHRSTTVHGSHESEHRKKSSVDSPYPFATIPSQGIQISPRQHSGFVQDNVTSSRSISSPFHHSGSPFNLQGLGYALPSISYAVHSPPSFTPSPPYNTYTDSAHIPGIAEADLWTQPPSFAPPQSERIHLHSELVYGTGHMVQWNMMLDPQTAISAFSDPSSSMAIYSGVPALDPTTQDLLHSPACPGAAKIIIHPRQNNQALAQWMDKWGPLEIYSSSLTFENEITVYEVLHAVYSYFQVRLSTRATDEMVMESKQRILNARAKRITFEGQSADKAEWNRPPKRIDVLALWSAFGGFDVRYDQDGGYNKLDEPGWRVVELELRLRNV